MSKALYHSLIKYAFKDKSLIQNALTHSSYTNENNLKESNERLEFLGDAIFDGVISEILYNRLPQESEGQLSKIRSAIVCEASLVRCGREMQLHNLIKISKGEESTGGRFRDSIIADSMEALMGAIYLDGGWEEAKAFIGETFYSTIEEAIAGKLFFDYKSEIQELLQKQGQAQIQYKVYKEEGPEHDKTFHVNLFLNGERIGQGKGKNKKEAEQQAAKYALEGRRNDVF